MIQKAIWFGHQKPTRDQIKEAKRDFDFKIVEIESGMALRNHPIDNDEDLSYVAGNLMNLVQKNEARAILTDSFPAAIQQAIAIRSILCRHVPESELIECFSSWEMSNKKHLAWCFVGYITRKEFE